jgi:septal ring factor EnvC (AmiA/AmiB activator)
VGDDGRYAKEGTGVPHRVARIGSSLSAIPRDELLRKVDEAVKEVDKDRFVLRKRTGWLIATLVLVSLGGIAYISATLLTREAQLDTTRDHVKDLQRDMDSMKRKNRGLERKLVEIRTELDNIKEH